MQILIFQSAHKRNLYISQKIFRPSHKRYPPCPSHWWIFPQTISQEIFPLPISQEIFLSQEILPQIITKEIFPLTISQKIFHLRIYNSAISQEIPLDHLSRNIFSTQPKSCGVGSWYKPWQSGFWSSGTGTSSAWCRERERTPQTLHLAPPNRQHSPDLINISSLPHSPFSSGCTKISPLLYQNPNLLVYIFIYILHHRSIPTRLCYNMKSVSL